MVSKKSYENPAPYSLIMKWQSWPIPRRGKILVEERTTQILSPLFDAPPQMTGDGGTGRRRNEGAKERGSDNVDWETWRLGDSEKGEKD